jgi:uncharacterized protein (DUF885 family)
VTPRDAEAVFDDLRRYWVEHSPVLATGLGDHSRDHDLDEWGPGTFDERLRALSRLAGAIDAVPPGDVEAEGDKILVADAIAAQRFELEGMAAPLHNPLFYLDLATTAVYDLVRRDDLDPVPLRRAVAARSAEVPRLLTQARDTLDGMSRPHREVAMLRIEGAAQLFRETVPAFAPEASDAAEEAAIACEAFGAWLELTRDDAGPDWRLGADRWADALRLSLGVELPADELWRRATEAVGSIQAEAEQIAVRVLEDAGAGTSGLTGRELVRAALEEIAQDTAGRDSLVVDAAGVLPEIVAFLRQLGQFDLPEPDMLKVEEVPAFQQGIAVAYFMPAPPLEPGAAHTYYLSPVPKDWDDEQAGSFLREYNLHALRSVGIHEAYPGHYVQLAHATSHPRLLRRALWNSAFAEGWAVYVEGVVVGAGFGGDRLALTRLKLELRSVANALLDQGLHVHGWDDDAAMNLMCAQAYQERSEAEGKLVRAQITAGQLSSYFVGGLEMADLRRDVEARQGDAFDPRAFHRAVLAQGTPPFAVLRRALLGT